MIIPVSDKSIGYQFSIEKHRNHAAMGPRHNGSVGEEIDVSKIKFKKEVINNQKDHEIIGISADDINIGRLEYGFADVVVDERARLASGLKRKVVDLKWNLQGVADLLHTDVSIFQNQEYYSFFRSQRGWKASVPQSKIFDFYKSTLSDIAAKISKK